MEHLGELQLIDRPATPPHILLPTEILSEIFNIYLAVSMAGEKFKRAYRKHILLLGKICVAWRAIVWSMAQLWTHLDVVLMPNNDKQVLLIGEWLARSSGSPLTICIDASMEYWNHGRRSPMSLVNTIAASSKGWQDIDILLPFSGFRQLDVVEGHLPILISVKLKLADYHGMPFKLMRNPIRAFSIAPQLRTVHLYEPLSPFQFLLPWHQLTSFYGENLFTDEWLEVLRNSPNLTHCTFDHGSTTRPSAIRLPISPLPLLHLIEIHAVFYGEISEHTLFDHITIPAARKITLQGGGGLFPIRQFVGLLSRSSCTLHWLSLKKMDVTAGQIRECLNLTPALVKLDIFMAIESDTVTAFTTALVLPCLKSLSICAMTSEGLTQILDSLTIPSVTTIELEGCNDHFAHLPFLALLKRSSCLLRRLSLKVFRIITPATLSDTFEAVPSVVELKLATLDTSHFEDDAPDSDIVANLLNPTGSNLRLLPNLQMLEYLDAPPLYFGDLARMLSMRWSGNDLVYKNDTQDDNHIEDRRTACLRTVTISSPHAVLSDDVLVKLDQLRAEGMKLDIQTCG